MLKKVKSFSLVIISILIASSVFGQGQKFEFFPGVEQRGGLYYKKNTDSLFSGSTKSTYNDGTPFITASFKDGKQHGAYTAYYATGQKMGVSHYEDGTKHGRSRAWHKNGELASKVDFKDGAKKGKLKMYYDNGQQSVEAHFIQDQLDGRFTQWDEAGNLHVIRSFDKGKLEWEEYYNQDDDTVQQDSI